MNKIHDMYGNELQIGDHVCFLQSLSSNSKELIRARVGGLREETGKRSDWTEGWVLVEDIQPEYLRKESVYRPRPLPKEKAASCCIKCY